ncbi:Fc.00g099470.m01.CDS01 [Cosmosporella sp. VM-42]
MDKSSAVPDGTPGVGHPASKTARNRSNTPDPSATPSTNTTGSQTSKQSSANNSVAPSPLASRDSSPTRPPRRTASATRFTGNRSRKNSQQDLSPARQNRPSNPGPTNSSRSLSSTTTPTLLPASQDQQQQIQSPTPRKPVTNPELRESPRWPVSPRLRSPPPQYNRPGLTSRLSEQELPAINVQRPSPSPQPSDHQATTSESEMEDAQQQSGIRTPARGALETVQEVSLPNSPNPTHDTVLVEKIKEKLSGPENQSDSAPGDVRTLRARPNLVAQESGSDSGNSRADQRRPTSVPPPLITRQSSAMSAKQMKLKQEGPTQSMTVETETVPSVPQVALATGPKVESNGTLKTKPSSETIKPKKEKKKTTRKQPSVNPGTGETPHLSSSQAQPKLRHHQSARSLSVAPDACLSPTSSCGQYAQNDELGSPRPYLPGPRTQSLSFYPVTTLLTRKPQASSKADIFEAKIASAIDETNTSDSEETFVYDSNPPDNNDRTQRRFHSRTPSATSMVSQADRQNLRSIYGVLEGPGGPAHGPKKGMKFVPTFNSNGNDSLTPGDEEGKGSGRSVAGGSGRGTVRQHHHIGRWGRQPGNGHPSLFDNESPFPNAARSKLTGARNSSGPTSPRNNRGAFGNKRTSMQMSSSYDLDDTTGADDERTPLLGSIRSARSGRSRRGPHNLRQAESQTFTRRQSYLNRFAACLVLTMMLMLVITGAIGFMFATSQPMTDIEITSIHNVVTSEQVLMFDLTVKAHNPNIVVVTIDHANLEIFAKSEYAGTDSDWWESPHGPESVSPWDDPTHVPLPNDPDDPDDDDDSKPNVLLGRITEFDSPLTFEGSLFHQGTSSSTGEMQLGYPGNQTSGGSRRWERIYQNEFDLIVKGVVKYSLPLSARIRSATVSGRKTIKPNSANDPNTNSTTLDFSH